MAKENKNRGNRQYSRKFFLLQFPPNHNPLIGTLQIDTIHNVHDAIALLQEITVCPRDDGFMFSEWSNTGYYYLMDCILRALRFEIYNRKKKQRKIRPH